MKPQRGFALLEAIAVIAIASLCAGALLTAVFASALLRATPDRNRAAAAVLAAQGLRVAENAWKYGSPGDAPNGSTAVSMPVPGAGSVPVTISSAISSQTEEGAVVAITVSYPPEQAGDSGAVTITGALRVKAPLPGSQLERPGLIPQPGTF
ncbi:MAG TPA: prepilin-type N-terminal cleavage/methylation domain-containing protein [Candidatus Rubrimentiphilum sp.]|nr:prepilin-type N-terminal cleavage/methylation domain-containing protein [Candidatus Rubrimentiphilum sp.]